MNIRYRVTLYPLCGPHIAMPRGVWQTPGGRTGGQSVGGWVRAGTAAGR